MDRVSSTLSEIGWKLHNFTTSQLPSFTALQLYSYLDGF
jgi:hypothetical protein